MTELKSLSHDWIQVIESCLNWSHWVMSELKSLSHDLIQVIKSWLNWSHWVWTELKSMSNDWTEVVESELKSLSLNWSHWVMTELKSLSHNSSVKISHCLARVWFSAGSRELSFNSDNFKSYMFIATFILLLANDRRCQCSRTQIPITN